MACLFFGIEFIRQIEVYYLTAAWLMISAVLMYLWSRTPLGRMANAVRDNPERAEFLGYSARWVRFYSFCASGFFAGIAGGLFAINYEIVTEEKPQPCPVRHDPSGYLSRRGGVLFFGPIIGAILFTLLQTVLSLQTEIWQLYLGILFVATVMYFPGGLAGLLMMHTIPLRLGKLHLLFVPYLKMLGPALLCVAGFVGVFEIVFFTSAMPHPAIPK
ncbi:branched-chain amino acid ABC transporter permease [Jhaorihella thermophila]